MKRVGYIVLAALGVLGVAVAFAFAFGMPQTPPSSVQSTPPSSANAEGGVAPPAAGTQGAGAGAAQGSGAPFGGEIIDGEVPEPDPESPFAFQIPGCKCHSDDPALVESHAQYRLNQCRGCHAGSP